MLVKYVIRVVYNSDVKIKGSKLVINLSPEQLKALQLKTLICSISNDKVQLSTLKPKDEFKIGDEVFIVLEQNGDRTTVISKEFAYNNKAFGGNSCWKKSDIRTLLNNDYYNKIAELVGENNIIPMKRDLTSLDGLDDYGVCYDRISLLSVFEYAKYHKTLGLKPNYSGGWWVITPYSTPSNRGYQTVCSIDTSGTIQWVISTYLRLSVRSFFTLKPSTMVVSYKN